MLRNGHGPEFTAEEVALIRAGMNLPQKTVESRRQRREAWVAEHSRIMDEGARNVIAAGKAEDAAREDLEALLKQVKSARDKLLQASNARASASSQLGSQLGRIRRKLRDDASPKIAAFREELARMREALEFSPCPHPVIGQVAGWYKAVELHNQACAHLGKVAAEINRCIQQCALVELMTDEAADREMEAMRKGISDLQSKAPRYVPEEPRSLSELGGAQGLRVVKQKAERTGW